MYFESNTEKENVVLMNASSQTTDSEDSHSRKQNIPSRPSRFSRGKKSIFGRLSLFKNRRSMTKGEIYAIQARHAIRIENEVVAKREAELERAIDRMRRKEFNVLVITEEDDNILEKDYNVFYGNESADDFSFRS